MVISCTEPVPVAVAIISPLTVRAINDPPSADTENEVIPASNVDACDTVKFWGISLYNTMKASP